MRSKINRSPLTALLVVLCVIMFMWVFGTSLLIVILNIGIGFPDNTADFRNAFLSMTVSKERATIEEYLQLSQRVELHPDIESLKLNLQTYESRYDPDITNLRFSATDAEGKLLLTNDPDYGKDMPLLASSVSDTSVSLGTTSQSFYKTFSDPVSELYPLLSDEGAIPQLLEQPDDFQIWYFSDETVNSVYQNGLDVLTLDGLFTDYMFFNSREEAEKFDYTYAYGEHCTTEITTSDTLSADQPERNDVEAPLTGGAAEEDDLDADTEKNNVVVKITAYSLQENIHISLPKYYEMKQNGMEVYANDPKLEELLNHELEITICTEHAKTVSCYLRTYLPEKLKVADTIRSNYTVFNFVFRHAEWAVIVMFVSLALTVIACILMCSGAGYSGDDDTITVPRIHQFAYEIFILLPPLIMVAALAVISVLSERNTPYRMIAIFCVGMILCIAASCTLWLYTTAIRVKAGTFWRSFGFIRFAQRFFSLFRNKTISCIICLLYALGLFVLNAYVLPRYPQFLVMLPIFVLDFLTLLFFIYCIYAYFELHRHVSMMENGNFQPTAHPVPLTVDFGRFDRSLDHITDRVGEIVAKQTKAEHLRTELITNVSHDLKTPLTSIVNYVDLLSREKMPNETAEEYLDVLRRQAARLKKLTIDLVDASKASTGNLNVELMPTDIQVLLEQIAGEYEGQLEKNNLSIMRTVPDEPIMILADSRQIWRVFDNLLSNACKYALSGTRVYLDVKTDDVQVEITVKNISAAPLNISPEMLMERFVRGDKSRHTEGSGLGLSIARDLTALQNGRLDLQTDGDLFKAVMTFPVYHPPILPQGDGLPQEQAAEPDSMPQSFPVRITPEQQGSSANHL